MNYKKYFSILAMACFSLFMCDNLLAQTSPLEQTLSTRQQYIVAIASYAAKGDLVHLKTALGEGLDTGLTVNEIKEILVHSYAYCGFPRSLRGLQTFIAVLDERKAKGINDEIGREASPITDQRSKYERGRDILAEISGVPADAPKAGYVEFAPIIEQFLKEHLFADIFERDVLTYDEREITTVAILAAMGGVEPMARSHMGICLNLGITPDQLRHLLAIIEKNIGHKEADAIHIELDGLLQSKGFVANASSEMTEATKKQALKADTELNIFPKGDLISSPNFTGAAWLQRLMTDTDKFDVVISNVVFDPGVRNSWHSHPGGQILIATSGEGYYQERGKPVQILNAGDVIAIPSNVVHWHGAAPDSEFIHIAINTKVSLGPAVWYEKVTDEEYNKILNP